ncbi:hypothetical protein C4D60_Mb07t03780 [Musa balbisiana]|uniref:Uncharacterized protein n=1 Tax=Musa balbisiana TaxID=52838 RepID=A0A4S8JCS3_MUSBA|nr:hypothetical protein C4D60_Mb07t03780 [Musa balbisiana]
MLRLFLQKPPPPPSDGDDGVGGGNKDAVEATLSLLRNLESVLWSVISSCGRYEARLWLCNTVSSIHSIAARDQLHLFMELLRSERSKLDVAPRLLQMIFEKRPQKAGRILAKRCYLLEKFFQGNPRRIFLWFDNFAGIGESGHQKGARALSLYAFANRDVCWEELEWKGKHGQSPAVVATKPHYFQDLDILQTIENFLEYVPDFWSSSELAESVKDGEILKLDSKYFVEQFVGLMYKEDLEDIWAAIEEFILEENFSSLSQNLLILLDEDRLLLFLKSIRKCIHLSGQCQDFAYPSCWLENLLATCDDQISLDELLLLNAVIGKGRQLLRLLADEEHEEEKGKVDTIFKSKVTLSDADHWALIKECINMKQQVAIKVVGQLSWVLHYLLARECMTAQSWEILFKTNGIHFQKADDYSLIQADGIRESDLDSDVEGWASGGKKKCRRDRKKRRKKYHRDGNSPDEIEIEQTNAWQGLQAGRSWFLSTDGFSCAWNIVNFGKQRAFKIDDDGVDDGVTMTAFTDCQFWYAGDLLCAEPVCHLN